MSKSEAEFKYWAFVSYSSKDAKIAKKLHRQLERYRIPKDLIDRPGRDGPIPTRIFPLFLHRDELPLSSDLGASINDALIASRYLIVLCSPDAAKSHWVNEEIRYFKAMGRADRILAIIVDGEPNATDLPDEAEQECFPPALRFKIDQDGKLNSERTEPIAGDLRKSGDGWSCAFLKCVAGITGLGFDAFMRREQKRQQQQKTLLTALALVAFTVSLWAWDYYRIKTSYFASYATRYGVPQGVAPMSVSGAKAANVSYQITSQRRLVTGMKRLSGAQKSNALSAEFDVDPWLEGIAQWRYDYDNQNRLSEVMLFDDKGRAKFTQNYSFSENGNKASLVFRRENNDGGSTAIVLATGTDLFGGMGSQKSEIIQHLLEFDQAGRITSRKFQNQWGTAAKDQFGAAGRLYVYDVNGLLTETGFLQLIGDKYVPLTLKNPPTIIHLSSSQTQRVIDAPQGLA